MHSSRSFGGERGVTRNIARQRYLASGLGPRRVRMRQLVAVAATPSAALSQRVHARGPSALPCCSWASLPRAGRLNHCNSVPGDMQARLSVSNAVSRFNAALIESKKDTDSASWPNDRACGSLAFAAASIYQFILQRTFLGLTQLGKLV